MGLAKVAVAGGKIYAKLDVVEVVQDGKRGLKVASPQTVGATNSGRPPVTNPTAQQVAAANDLSLEARWVRADGSIDWPPNDGFAGTPEVINLQPGARIDRYGSNNSGFLSPFDTSFEQRALPVISALQE